MMKRIVSLLLCGILLISLLPLSVFAVTTVDSITITNIAAPVDGNGIYPGATAGSSAYKVYCVDWYNVTDGTFMSVGDTFRAGKVYRADVWVEACSGYEFKYKDSQTPDVRVTLNGRSVPAQKAFEYAPWAMIVASYTFDPCPKKEISHVDIELGTIAEGEYVPFALQNQPDKVVLYPNLHDRFYPYGFNWSNMTKNMTAAKGEKFKGGCEYYVSIALRPQYSTYVFTDNFTATINGKSATIKGLSETSVIVEVGFTCYGAITYGDINPAITTPKTGNIPDFGVFYKYPQCNHIAMANPLAWYDVQTGIKLTYNDTFRAGKSYRAELTLIADYPYKFQRDANDKMPYAPYMAGEHVDEYVFGWDDYRGRETITLKKTYTMPEPEHTHTPSGWRTNQVYHYKACTTCGEFLEQDDHSGGTATCAKKAKCSVCKYTYGELSDRHTFQQALTPRGEQGHAALCTECGAYSAVDPHIPGPEATETAPQTCKECGYIITPAKNHTHKLNQVEEVPATCDTDGTKAHYSCVGCSNIFTDAGGKNKVTDAASLVLPQTGHTPAGEWTACAGLYHAKLCTVCGAHCTIEDHTPLNALCTVCGYDPSVPEATDPSVPEATDPSVPGTTDPTGSTEPGQVTDPTQSEADQPTEQPQTVDPSKADSPGWLLIALVGIAVFALAVTATVLILKKKK